MAIRRVAVLGTGIMGAPMARRLAAAGFDVAAWNRDLMLKTFPYLKDVKIDLAWGGPMACSANLFPQIGTLPDRDNVFYVQGYSGFGVTPRYAPSSGDDVKRMPTAYQMGTPTAITAR